MVHVPETMKVAFVPETVQTLRVEDEKVTVKPEVAVAESASGVPTVCAGGVAKVMVCEKRACPAQLNRSAWPRTGSDCYQST